VNSPLDEPWRLPGLNISVVAAPLSTDWLLSRVSPPSAEIANHVEAGGLHLDDLQNTDRGLFKKAAEAIAWVPSLAVIVATRVATVHLLRADPSYDVSHSEPEWRDRIFVSVPDRHDEVGALRLAEGIIHEALHLHLNELEAITPLVRDGMGTLTSPWRAEPRSFGGVLHGVFVFVGLKAYFDVVKASPKSPAGRHLDQRRAGIVEELSRVELAELAAGLTEPGATLLSRLLAGGLEMVAKTQRQHM
jgi:HEXXH motif-containing protein